MKTKINQFWKRHKKKILIMGLLAAIAIFIFPALSFAQDGSAAAMGPAQSALDDTYQQIAKLLNVVNKILQRLLWPVLLLIGGLLKNDILFGAGMENIMYSIWSNIRDFVNIFFVLVLLGIALYNVLGIQSQNFQLKQILPKFVIALIAVNFSFLAVKVVIDSVSVLTTAIFSLPAVVQEDGDKTGIPTNPEDIPNPEEAQAAEDAVDVEKQVCEAFYGPSTPITDYQANVTAAMAEGTAMCLPTDPHFTEDIRKFFSRWDANNAALVLAINMAKIPALSKVQTLKPKLEDLMLNMAFSAILYAIYAAAFIVLFVVLLVRLVVLWVTIVLSPLMVFKYVLPDNLKSLLGGGDDITKKFIQTVIVPIPIAVVLTIGYIMLNGMLKAKILDVSFSSSTLSLSLFASELTTLQDIIVAVGTVAVVWMGVFAASKGTFADKAVEGIEKMVSGAGGFIAGTWKYMPMFPVKGEKFSAAALGETMRQVPLRRQDKANERARELMSKFGMGTGQMEGDKLRKAQNWEDVQKQFYGAGSSGVGTRNFQEGLHVYIQKHRNDFKKNVDLSKVKLTADGTPIQSQEELEKALKEGKVDDDSMAKLREHIVGQMPTSAKEKADKEKEKEDKEAEEKKKKEGAAGGKPAEGEEAGGKPAEGEAAGGEGAPEAKPEAPRPLSEAQKKNVAAATGASLYAGVAGVTGEPKDWKDEDFRKVQDAMQGRVSFSDKVREAKTKEELVAAIQQRREELGGGANATKDAQANANRIIKYEVGSVIAAKKDKSMRDDPEIKPVMDADAPTESGLKYEPPEPPKPKKPAAGGGGGGGGLTPEEEAELAELERKKAAGETVSRIRMGQLYYKRNKK